MNQPNKTEWVYESGFWTQYNYYGLKVVALVFKGKDRETAKQVKSFVPSSLDVAVRMSADYIYSQIA